ncbi:MAG: MFS transporter [Candidatus Pacebacteria bacterium]|nr:MFS transporter [Candidatus Paceibacterota bacterium]
MFKTMKPILKINKIVKFLILSDIAFWTGWGLLTPVFAIFVVEKIQGGNALVVGLASAVILTVRSLLRIPIGRLLDKKSSDKDDYFVMVLGTFIVSIVPFGFIFSFLPWHIYFLEAIHGMGLALALSGWTAIFTRNIDKGKESTQWGWNETSLGLGMGLAGGLGGFFVTKFGFDLVFSLVGILGITGVFILLGLKNEIKGVFDQGLKVPIKDIFGPDSPDKLA